MSKYFTYIALCSDDSLYTGYCVDLKAREAKHNAGKGAKYTRNKTPVEIVYYEVFINRSEAMKREYEIKTWPRKKKLELIKKTHQQ
jgi:putative endonuclease